MRNKRGIVLLAILVLLVGLMPQSALAEQTSWTERPEPVCAYPFNINPNPKSALVGTFPVETGRAPYIIFRNLPEGAVVRVYDAPVAGAKLLGKGQADNMFSATIGINVESNPQYVYYTIQVEGKTESTTKMLSMGTQLSPRVEFSYGFIIDGWDDNYNPVSKYDLPIEQNNSYLWNQRDSTSVDVGEVLAVDVRLKDVPYLTGLTLPIRYDTEVFEMLGKKVGDNGYMNTLSTEPYDPPNHEYTASAETLGEKIGPSGLVVGNSMYYKNNMVRAKEELEEVWLGQVRQESSSNGNRMPYINTETGFINFGASVGEDNTIETDPEQVIPPDFGKTDDSSVGKFDTSGKYQTIVRLFLRYKGTKSTTLKNLKTSSTLKYGDEVIKTGLAPVRVATKEECPPEFLGTKTAAKFYNVSYPEGVVPQIGYVNVFAPNPPALYTVDNDWADMDHVPPQDANLSVGDIIGEYTEETLPVDHVKVYNFTNSGYNVESTATLDDLSIGKLSTFNYTNSGTDRPLDNIRDYMKIQFTSVGSSSGSHSGANLNDIVKVYPDKTTLEPIATKQIVDMGVHDMEIDLGTSNLSPDGGKLYLALERGDLPGSESERVEIDYDKEYKRDVYLEVYRENYTATENKIELEKNSDQYYQAMNARVHEGEKFQVKIYFNDFRDLRGYMLPLAFNAQCVKVADLNFNAIADGGVTMKQVKTGTRGIQIGKDFSDCSAAEFEIWTIVTDILEQGVNVDEELQKVVDAYKTEFPDEIQDVSGVMRIYEEVETKLQLGVPGVNVWYGGLLFSEPQSDAAEPVPYILNNPATGENGLIDIWAMALKSSGPMLDRYDSETGEFSPYHVLTINFVGEGVLDTVPDFHMAENSGGSGDANYSIGSPGGFSPVIMGEQGDVNDATRTGTPGHTEHWSIQKYVESKQYELVLNNRPEETVDAGETNGEKTDLYTYFNQSFQDPGFIVNKFVEQDDGTIQKEQMDSSEVERELVVHTKLKDGTKLELPAIPMPSYSENEVLGLLTTALTEAGVKGKDFAKLDAFIKYTYTPVTVTPVEPIQATRKLFVIHQRGDINRDGVIDDKDYTALMNHVTRKKPIVEFDSFLNSAGEQTNTYYDPEYALNVGDVNSDGKIYPNDTAPLKLEVQYGIKIQQKYQIPQAVTPAPSPSPVVTPSASPEPVPAA